MGEGQADETLPLASGLRPLAELGLRKAKEVRPQSQGEAA
jgi:hypothetical protein